LREMIPEAFGSNFVEIRGQQMHFRDLGTGTPVVMVHGNPTWSLMFDRLIVQLQGNFRCVALDHLGCGLSDKPTDLSYSYKNRVADFSAFIQKTLGTQSFHLIAHDWGGAIACHYAGQHPEQILSLTLCNTAAFPNPKGFKIPASIAWCRRPWLGRLLVQSPINAFVRGTLNVATARPIPRQRRKAYGAPYNSWSNRRAIKAFVDDIPLRESDGAMPLLRETARNLTNLRKRPVLLFWGAQDFVFDKRFFDTWGTYFPEAEQIWLEDAGHLVLEEARPEELAYIRRFLLKAEPQHPFGELPEPKSRSHGAPLSLGTKSPRL
jgi:pimeloyl-ACP methyl ester carboxylesterase